MGAAVVVSGIFGNNLWVLPEEEKVRIPTLTPGRSLERIEFAQERIL